MALKQVIEAYELLSSAYVDGDMVAELLRKRGITDITVEHVKGETTSTDFLSCLLPGQDPERPALGIIGRLGGLGARPEMIGLVSDSDGAITAVAAALKLADMSSSHTHTHLSKCCNKTQLSSSNDASTLTS